MPVRVLKENENPFSTLDPANLSSVTDYFNSSNKGFRMPLENLPGQEAHDLFRESITDLNFASAFGDFIFESELKALRRNVKERLPDFGDNPKIFVSSSCWYSLEEIRRFIRINDMENTTKFTNPGIRFYFGLVDDVFMDGAVEKHCLRLTTILVPTKEVDSGVAGKQNQDTLEFTSIAGRSSFDHGDLCPPKCNGSIYDNDHL